MERRAALPLAAAPMLCVRTDDTQADIVRTTLDLLAREVARPALGTSVVSSRLADIVFVNMIRAHLASDSGAELGWLRALGHPQLGLALRAIHHEPEPPLEYLTRWRMFRTGQLFREGKHGLSAIASLVGYDSAGALSRAFARVYGRTPRQFRSAT